VAGALTFEDAVTVIYHRARLQHQTAGTGRLISAAITPERAFELPSVVAGRIAIAAVNSPVSVALVGQVPDLEEVKAMLDAEDVFCRFVDGSVPFHSPLMDPLEPELRECLAGLAPVVPAIPLYSTVTGRLVTAVAHDASYWWGNVRDPVRFMDGTLAMIDDGITAFVEVGPHPVLSRSVADCLSARVRHGFTVPSLKRGKDDAATMAHACAELYVAGYAPDWDAFYPGGSFQRLPAYPWQRERYWKEADATRHDRLGELEHTFLGAGGDLPLPTWRRYLDGSRPGYLTDHRVMDSNLFPGAGYVEMALAAGRSLFGAPHCVAERVRFEAPVIIRPGAAYMLDTTVDQTTGRVAIYGRQPDGTHWVRHASARLAPAAVSRPVLDLDAIRARCPGRQDGSEFYAAIRGHGFDYGPAFRPIARLWLGDGEALGEFGSGALAPSAEDDLILDPVALDGCFQMLLPLISSAVEEHAALLPIGVDRIIVHDRPSGPLWVHASATRAIGDDLSGDAVLMTADGQAVIEVRGFHARIVGAEQQARARLGNRWLYEVTWEAAELAAGESAAPGRWLVLADRGGVADQIVGQLTAAGHAVVVARPGTADLEAVVRDVAGSDDMPVRGVVYLSPADLDSEAESVPDVVAAGLKPLLHLVQALDTDGLAWPLTIVTTGAQPAGDRPDRAGLLQAPLWGIGRVLHQESLALRTRLLDLDPQRPLADIPALVTELLQAAHEEDQVAWRGGQRRVARLQPARRDSGSVPVTLRPDASYLVTGGTGSLGLLYARWLAEHGARRIVLMSRSPLPPRSQWDDLPPEHAARQPVISAIRDIEELGAIVETASLDAADEAGLRALIEQRHAAHLPPVRGVIHSAGTVQDQVMVKMTDDQLDRVLQPKVGGAWSLHRAFADWPLDFFVLFSSVSSVVVTAGQGNYAAGNAFLDGLAHYRRASGLPALSINWGPWDTGMIAQLQLQPFYQRRGLDLISEETGAEIFSELLGSSEVQQIVVSADWPTLVASYPIVPRLIEHLAQADQHAADGDQAGAVSVAERLAAASATDHLRVVTDCCAEIIGGVLRIRPDSLDRDVPLNQLGLDSMIAVEVRVRLEQAFGVAPKVVFLLQGITVAGVAAYLEEKLVPPVGDASAQDLASLLADLSPEAAEELLAQVTRPTTKGSDQ
jgi:hybrid polyketide synthase/nonribosomal peptide synthetase FtdB